MFFLCRSVASEGHVKDSSGFMSLNRDSVLMMSQPLLLLLPEASFPVLKADSYYGCGAASPPRRCMYGQCDQYKVIVPVVSNST